jgi:hypothetical protein
MPALIRRRGDDPHRETSHVYFGDVRVGSIGERAGVPVDVERWQWSCGFYPPSHRGIREDGIAPSLFEARAAFAAAWARIEPLVTKRDFLDCRRERACTAWKYRMWDCGCRMPAQNRNDRSTCFCGVEITTKGATAHIYECHMDPR